MPDTETARYQEIPLYRIPQALALDFDRTLGNVAVCMERFYSAAQGVSGIDVEEIKAQKLQVEASGHTFDPLKYVERALIPAGDNPDHTRYDEFCDRFISMDEPKVLYDDAERFLDMLQKADMPHIILTYGNNFEWQRLKLLAAGYPFSRKIMDHSNKGAQIKEYQQPDGTFHFRVTNAGAAEYIAAVMVLVDDKSSAFNELPKEYPGFKIIRGNELPNQQGSIPDRVQSITSLDELTVVGGVLKIKEVGDPLPDNNVVRRQMSLSAQSVRAIYEPTTLPRGA